MSETIPTLGTGFWRGPGDPPDPVGQTPDPADAGQSRVPLSDLPIPDPDELERRIEHAALALLAHTKPDEPDGMASGNTDASGNAVFQLYEVRAGYRFRVTRAVIEAQGFTPAAPYSNAAAWMGLFDLDAISGGGGGPGVEAYVQGALRDFAPLTAGAPILPGIFSDGGSEAAIYRGPCAVGFRIASGPASRRITVYYRGILQREEGIV